MYPGIRLQMKILSCLILIPTRNILVYHGISSWYKTPNKNIACLVLFSSLILTEQAAERLSIHPPQLTPKEV